MVTAEGGTSESPMPAAEFDSCWIALFVEEPIMEEIFAMELVEHCASRGNV